MKYYNTSLGNCAAPSSGVYQVSNTLIRKPPLWPPFLVARVAGELRDFFPNLSPLPFSHSSASPYARLRRLPWRRFPRATRRKITGMFAERKVKKRRVERSRFPARNFVKYISCYHVKLNIRRNREGGGVKSILDAVMTSITGSVSSFIIVFYDRLLVFSYTDNFFRIASQIRPNRIASSVFPQACLFAAIISASFFSSDQLLLEMCDSSLRL